MDDREHNLDFSAHARHAPASISSWANYAIARDDLTSRSLQCLGVGYFSGYYPSFLDRRLPSYGAVLIVEGSGWFRLSGQHQRQYLRAPALLWLQPGLLHSYGPDDDGWTEAWMLFGGVSSTLFEAALGVSRRSPSATLRGGAQALVTEFSILGELLSDTTLEGALAASVRCQGILNALIPHTRQMATAQQPGPVDYVDAVRAAARENWTVPERARRLGISAQALREACVSVAGLTPASLVTQQRIVNARALLVGSDAPVADVARTVGFEDPAYFSRVFRRTTGQSPQRFRHQEQRRAASSLLPQRSATNPTMGQTPRKDTA